MKNYKKIAKKWKISTVWNEIPCTSEKPYVCDADQCTWRGVDSSSLIHHKKKHAKQIKDSDIKWN